MSAHPLHRLALLLLLLLAACGTPPVATPLPTPQPVFLTYPPELRPYAEALAACARQYPEAALYLNETLAEPAPDGQSSLFLAMGSQPAAFPAGRRPYWQRRDWW